MLLATAIALLAFQGTPAPAAQDTVPDAFDSPATRELVERVTRAGSVIPEELADYRADYRSAVYLSLRPDSALAGEVPVTVDEFAGTLRWERGGSLLQEVAGHRVRMLAPTPYSVGSLLEQPWIVPHLYGQTIDLFQLSPTPAPTAAGRTVRRISRAVHPFSARGMQLYRYSVSDTVRVRTTEGIVRLVTVDVRPRAVQQSDAPQMVVGSFQVDLDRAAIARARFGFAEPGGRFRLTRTGVFFEMENGLVQDRFWLPYRQRQEIQISSPLFGGAAAIRVASTLSGYDLNTRWSPEEPGRAALVRRDRGGDAFRGWGTVGEGIGDFDIADFNDLARETTGAAARDEGRVRVSFLPERGEHFFRYNRVEGPFLGGAVGVEQALPDGAAWQVYATAGWAFSEGTARGEATALWIDESTGPFGQREGWSASGGVYRRLRDTQAFRPAFRWDLGYSLNAALGGYDILDYYDATGVEAAAGIRRGRLTGRLGGRWERHDSVTRNTDSFLFGRARRFPEVAPADPGTHAGVEGELRYGVGGGAFALGNSLVASLRGEAGFADWSFGRVTGLLAARRSLGPFVTLALRGDAGHVAGDVPPQFLIRFGEAEGLRGYEPNEFGGTTAAIGRARLLLFLPPYTQEPLARAGFFIVPPLRPALVLSGSSAWADVADRSADELFRVGSRPTDGARRTVGIGVSIFEDAFAVEYSKPLEEGERGRWTVGLVSWF
ncbi:MAG TPA: hypothetical protein VGR37_19585 [Longimicrobiaceae bacterium]|nr:hypothetical protein [Longimicrobiaceae bacterium]